MSSTTMTMTVPVLASQHLSSGSCCPNCNADLLSLPASDKTTTTTNALAAAQAQIDDMHAQIRLLNDKATAAVDRWADYEDELAALRKELLLTRDREEEANSRRNSNNTVTTTTAPQTPTVTTTATTPSPTSPRPGITNSPGMGFAAAATNRISALLSRKSTPNLKALPTPSTTGTRYSNTSPNLLPTPPHSGGGGAPLYPPPKSPLGGGARLIDTPPPSTEDLLDALTREQQLRLAAEAKLNDTSREVEELSVSLFEEANEMVATERRERARLEARVGELEKRDREKKVRLERLEGAVQRIDRARSVLAGSEAVTVTAVTPDSESGRE